MLIALGIAIGLAAGAAVAVVLIRRRPEPAVVEDVIADQVKALTADALRGLVDLNRELRDADREAAAKDLERREQALKSLADPIAEKLGRVEREISELAKDRKANDAATVALLQQMRSGMDGLATETAALKKALRQPQTRGSWGEVQLRRCVELSGMTQHVDFELQQTIRGTDDGVMRPDALVMLPADKRVVVDSKVPLDAYLEALEAEDDKTRRAELLRHSRQAREHIRALASKRYQDQFKAGQTPDFVVCFIPSEGALHAAFEADPELYAYALDQGVLLATPVTLIGLLRTIELGWRQERLAAEAQEIADAGRELHGRFGPFLAELVKVGRSLNSATGAYNGAVGSLERRVLPQLRRFEELGAGSGKDLDDCPPLDQSVRHIAAAELSLLEEHAAEAASVAELPESEAA